VDASKHASIDDFKWLYPMMLIDVDDDGNM